jgi:hypothetical protein
MTWNTLQYYYSGQQLSAGDWNNYIGTNGNIAYLRNNYYMQYYASFIAGTSVLHNTFTDMSLGTRNGGGTTFTIPSSWGSGRYYYEAMIVPNTTETIVGVRSIRPIINATTYRTNSVLPLAASGSNKMQYEYRGIENLASGSTIKISYAHSSGVTTTYNLFFIIQRVSP